MSYGNGGHTLWVSIIWLTHAFIEVSSAILNVSICSSSVRRKGVEGCVKILLGVTKLDKKSYIHIIIIFKTIYIYLELVFIIFEEIGQANIQTQLIFFKYLISTPEIYSFPFNRSK